MPPARDPAGRFFQAVPAGRPAEGEDPDTVQTAESRQFFVYPLTLVKGVLILCILVLHVTGGFRQISQPGLLSAVLMIIHSLARIGLPLFFVLSGFYLGLNARNECAIPFYRRTLKFLVIPWVVYSLFFSMPPLLLRGDVHQFFRSLWVIATSGQLSFMSIIIQLYLLHPFLRRWYRTRGRHEAILLGAFALQILWSTSIELLTQDPNALQRCFPGYIGYFFAGYYLLDHSEEAVRWAHHPALVGAGGAAWIATAIAMAVFVDLPMQRDLPWIGRACGHLTSGFLVPLMSFSALAIVVPLARKGGLGKTWAGRILQSLGLYAFGIYLLHRFFMLVFGTALRRGLGLGFDDALFYFLLLVLTTFGTLLTLRTLAKLPFGRYVT